MLNNHPRPDEFFNGRLENPISAASFLGKGFSQTPIKILFEKDKNGLNAKKDALRYADSFDIVLLDFDFKKRNYRACIYKENKETHEIIGSIVLSESSGEVIESVTFFSTKGGYPIKEEVDVYEISK